MPLELSAISSQTPRSTWPVGTGHVGLAILAAPLPVVVAVNRFEGLRAGMAQ
jgi:hypothetical protein